MLELNTHKHSIKVCSGAEAAVLLRHACTKDCTHTPGNVPQRPLQQHNLKRRVPCLLKMVVLSAFVALAPTLCVGETGFAENLRHPVHARHTCSTKTSVSAAFAEEKMLAIPPTAGGFCLGTAQRSHKMCDIVN